MSDHQAPAIPPTPPGHIAELNHLPPDAIAALRIILRHVSSSVRRSPLLAAELCIVARNVLDHAERTRGDVVEEYRENVRILQRERERLELRCASLSSTVARFNELCDGVETSATIRANTRDAFELGVHAIAAIRERSTLSSSELDHLDDVAAALDTVATFGGLTR